LTISITDGNLRRKRQSGSRTDGEEFIIRVVASGSGAIDISASGSALPVKLSSFTGKQINDVILLDWSTSSETNSDYSMSNPLLMEKISDP
jgi:hypothetical protein